MELATRTAYFPLARSGKLDVWTGTAAALIFGYLSLSRAFAYIGIPPWKLFISEIVLGLFLLCGPTLGAQSWVRTAALSPNLKRFRLVFAAFLACGALQVLHGIFAGNPPLLAARDFAFNYYPLYMFIGLWAGHARPDLLPKLLRAFAWFNGIYGSLYLLTLNRIEWYLPGVADEVAPVPVFGQPIFSLIALLGVIAYEQKIQRSWHLLALNLFVMFGMQLRTEWLAFAVGLVVWFMITRQWKRLLQAFAVFLGVFAVMYITDMRLPGPEGRGGGEISVRQLVDRAVAPFRADTTSVSAAAGVGAETQEATLVWRTVWWLLIWNGVHADFKTALWGFGYGYPLGDLAPYLKGEFLRTPHNAFFYALGYSGWIGVIIFFAFQGTIFRLLRVVHRRTKEPFGLSFFVAMMVYEMFFPFGETPYAAVPFYLLVGWLAAPLLLQGGARNDEQDYVASTTLFPAATASWAHVSRFKLLTRRGTTS